MRTYNCSCHCQHTDRAISSTWVYWCNCCVDSIGTPVDRVCPKNRDRLESSVTFLGMGGVRISESLECETYIVIVEFGTTDRKIPWMESLPNEWVLLI